MIEKFYRQSLLNVGWTANGVIMKNCSTTFQVRLRGKMSEKLFGSVITCNYFLFQ